MTQFTPLRSQLNTWTLEDDNKCFLTIQNFTESFMNKANEIQNSFKDTEYNLNTFKAIVNNNFSKLSNLQNEKFTENKMAQTDDSDLFFSQGNKETEEKTENEIPLAQKYQEAINSGMKSMNIDQLINDANDTGNDDQVSVAGANDDKMSQFSQFTHIPSKHNKLPGIIGTSNFYNDPYLGIIELDDQVISKSQVQDLMQSSQLVGFQPTQTIVNSTLIQQSTIIQPQQEQQQEHQVTTNPSAPSAPSLDLLVQGAASKKVEAMNPPPLPQINIQAPPQFSDPISISTNDKIEQSIMLAPSSSQQNPKTGMQESIAIKPQVKKPMFEDISDSSSNEEQQQPVAQQQQYQQMPAQQTSIQDAFMQKLKKMQENKEKQDMPQQQPQQLQQQQQQKQQAPVLQVSTIESPTILQSEYFSTGNENKERNIVQTNDKKKGMNMFGDDDEDENDDKFLFKNSRDTEIRKLGTLLVDDDEENDDMFGKKKTNQQQQQQQQMNLPSLPPLSDMPLPPQKKQEKGKQNKEPQQSQQYSQQKPLITSQGNQLPNFDFDDVSRPSKKSLLPKAKTQANAFDDIPPPPKQQQQQQQQQQQSQVGQKKKLTNLFDDEDEDDDFFFKKK